MNVAKNVTNGDDNNYFEQIDNQENTERNYNDNKPTYSKIAKKKTHTKVHEFKLKIANNAEVPKLSDAELSKIVLWATAAAKGKAIL